MEKQIPSAGSHISYQANVNRQKTRKWAVAKPANYGGDEWGEDDFDFDPLPIYVIPAGLRQQGQETHSLARADFPSLNDGRPYGDLLPLPEPVEVDSHRRKFSSDTEDEKRRYPHPTDEPFSAGKAIPFIRPSDIYRRMEEERGREGRYLSRSSSPDPQDPRPRPQKLQVLPPGADKIKPVNAAVKGKEIDITNRSLALLQDFKEPSTGLPSSTIKISPALPPRAQKIKPGNKEIMGIEFSHTKYASQKVVPFISISSWVTVRSESSMRSALSPARKVLSWPENEVAILRELNHQHIIQVVCTYETISVPRQFGILLSPVGEEDLLHYMERVSEDDFPEKDIANLERWRYCLANAVAYIHSQNIRHKDIKPSNVICKGAAIYLTDFGSAHQFSIGLTSSTDGGLLGVTKMYSAPEVIDEDRRGRSADIFSLGCVFAEMTTVIHGRRVEDFHDFRSEPDHDELDHDEQDHDEPQQMTICYYATAYKLRDWFATGKEKEVASYTLISAMMSSDRKRRPTAEELKGDLLQVIELSSPCQCFQTAQFSGLPALPTHDPLDINYFPDDKIAVILPSESETSGTVQKLVDRY
ncbi:kinase-like domain-containing protein [Hyaloscypha sp. PMI_1271]|nr:kinase-like domain-containing protein [Hyaloscypha sp. PMI_1271]